MKTVKANNLHEADLRWADLHGADLRGADLRGANLTAANLHTANLSSANLTRANLSGANLSRAIFCGATLQGANLENADLEEASLAKADLSGSIGLLAPHEFIATLEQDHLGIIVYKRIGNTEFDRPKHWNIARGACIDEVCNYDRCTECACGVNVGTKEWCLGHYVRAQLWRCRIRWMDLAGVCVPYDTEGKFRAARVELLEIVSPTDEP